jgi:hypothetical protein
MYTCPPPAAAAASIALCIAAVSSVMPSPLAPKFCTLKIMSLSPYQAKTSEDANIPSTAIVL